MASDDDFDSGVTTRGFIEGQRVLGRYLLKRMLGRGGMGIVWLARDEKLEEEVALKFLPDTVRLDAMAIDELKRETRRSRALTHANIVRIHDFVEDNLTAAIAMEYVDGETLTARRIKTEKRIFEVGEINDWMGQLCKALAYAHEEAMIVHRDLKPANVLMTSKGRVKVSDFGISSSISDSMSRVSMRPAGSGTLAYMSPQQLRGDVPTPSDDIYAFGATIYELLTSKPPFFRGDLPGQIRDMIPVSMAEKRKEFGIEDAAEIPGDWERLVAACLSKEPEGRPQRIADLAAFFGEAVPSTRTAGTAIGLPPPPPVKKPDRRWLWIGAAAGILAVAGGVWAFLGNRVSSPALVVKEDVVATPTPVAATPTPVPETPTPTPDPAKAEAAFAQANELFDRATDDDDKKAVELYKQAAEMGLDKAYAGLARAYILGRGVPKDSAAALKILPKATAVNDPLAETCMGRLYEDGEVVSKDMEAAVNWYRKAALQGYVPAQYHLGLMYHGGDGVPENDESALLWFRMAADQGQKESQYYTGWAYLNGLGVKKNPEEARRWLLKAADQGDADAQYSLGVMALDEENPNRDEAEAKRWFERAAQQNHPEAQENLRRMDAAASQDEGGPDDPGNE